MDGTSKALLLVFWLNVAGAALAFARAPLYRLWLRVDTAGQPVEEIQVFSVRVRGCASPDTYPAWDPHTDRFVTVPLAPGERMPAAAEPRRARVVTNRWTGAWIALGGAANEEATR